MQTYPLFSSYGPSFLNVAALMFITQGYFALIEFVRNPSMVLNRKWKNRYP